MTIPLSVPAAGTRAFDVVGFGENSLDLVAEVAVYPPVNSKARMLTWRHLPGGQVATAMVACSRLGLTARYVGRFGDDDHGVEGVESLAREGVDTGFAVRVPGTTSRVAFVIVERGSGERTVLWHRHEGLAMPVDAVPREAVQSGRFLLVDGTDMPAATCAARMARESGTVIVADVDAVRPGVDALLDTVDVIIAAEMFPREFTGIDETAAALSALAGRFPRARVVCVTLGEQGSLARSEGAEIRTPALPTACVDSTGAGDVFRAGFIAGWIRGGPDAELGDVLRFANAAAGLNCRALGARTASPRPHEVEELLHSNPWPP